MSNVKTKNVWKLKDLLSVSALMVIVLAAAVYALKETGALSYLDSYQSLPLTVVVVTLIQWCAMLGPLWFFVLRKMKNPWEALGFNKDLSWYKCVKYAVIAYIIYFAINFLINILTLSLGIDLPGYHTQPPHLPIFGNSIWGLPLAILVMVVIAPIVEEIFFRGFILNTIVERFGRYGGNMVSAAIFAAFHFELQSFLALMLIGVILNELFLRTKSIKATIIFHTINNSLALLLEYYLQTIQV